jgi:hypothetical protein
MKNRSRATDPTTKGELLAQYAGKDAGDAEKYKQERAELKIYRSLERGRKEVKKKDGPGQYVYDGREQFKKYK